MNILEFSVHLIENFALIFGRIVGFIAILPIFGSAMLPSVAKVALALSMALIVAPILDVVPVSTSMWQLGLHMLLEIVIGLLIGFVCYALIFSAAMAGQIIDQQNSLAQATEFDPVYGIQTPLTGEFFFIIFSVTFMYIGGHLFLLEAIAQSFDYISVGGVQFLNKPILDLTIMMLGYVFIIGFKISAPIFAALFVVTVVLGLISKSIPQINVMVLGMPLKIGISFIFTIFSLPIIKWIFERGWYDLEFLIVRLLKQLGGVS